MIKIVRIIIIINIIIILIAFYHQILYIDKSFYCTDKLSRMIYVLTNRDHYRMFLFMKIYNDYKIRISSACYYYYRHVTNIQFQK